MGINREKIKSSVPHKKLMFSFSVVRFKEPRESSHMYNTRYLNHISTKIYHNDALHPVFSMLFDILDTHSHCYLIEKFSD